MTRFKVWECKIVVAGDTEIPDGFDFPPRHAAVKAIEAGGIDVISCFSGWAGTLTETQTEIVEEKYRGDIIQSILSAQKRLDEQDIPVRGRKIAYWTGEKTVVVDIDTGEIL